MYFNSIQQNNVSNVVKCFNAPLQPAEIVGVVVQEKLLEGVNELGLTLTGFLFLHALIIEKGRIETTWTVLRNFRCNDDLKLRDDYLSIPNKKAPDQSVALTSEAVEFLKGIFSTFDDDKIAVALAVAASPEGLPAVVTTCWLWEQKGWLV